MTITNIFIHHKLESKVRQIESLFQEAKYKIIQILVHPDTTKEQLAEAVAALRALDRSVNDIRTKVWGALK